MEKLSTAISDKYTVYINSSMIVTGVFIVQTIMFLSGMHVKQKLDGFIY